MLKKTIASGALSTSAPGNYSLNKAPHAQRGVTLLELMVGIAIGLLVVAVAMGALMVSRGVTGTVSDASGIQQQGAYAMRLFGQQLRQAGSLRLNRNPGTVVAAELYLAPVAFETKATSATPLYSFDATKPEQIISGTAAPVTLVVGYRRYTEPTFISATDVSPSRNCLGGPADSSNHERLESTFWVSSKNELRCAGNPNPALASPPTDTDGQPVLQNVANFQVRYLVQNNTAGNPTLSQVDASGVTNWAQVQAVEVCLVLYGAEAMDLPAGSNYTDCDGTAVDMSTLTGVRARRMHVPFRNVFQLRSQGLIGTVL
ncbi:MAG: prepilin-type N-terminal cleavage/methylation domain-containing protein [Alicycliphilus sp.]|nr:MAG: prepilin-type N-terminal cleavage/methylation domain-containing protein [Alicycliphilus sp.]